MRRFALALSVVALIPFTRIHAQEQTSDREFPEEPSLTWPILGGALMGLGGWVTGGVIGVAAYSDCYELECVEGFIVGAAVGGTVGLAVGTHLGNRRRGNVALDVLSGAGVWFVSLGAAHLVGNGYEGASVAVWIIEPIAQFITTVAIERAMGRARAQRHLPQVSVIPQGDGSFALGVSLSF